MRGEITVVTSQALARTTTHRQSVLRVYSMVSVHIWREATAYAQHAASCGHVAEVRSACVHLVSGTRARQGNPYWGTASPLQTHFQHVSGQNVSWRRYALCQPPGECSVQQATLEARKPTLLQPPHTAKANSHSIAVAAISTTWAQGAPSTRQAATLPNFLKSTKRPSAGTECTLKQLHPNATNSPSNSAGIKAQLHHPPPHAAGTRHMACPCKHCCKTHEAGAGQNPRRSRGTITCCSTLQTSCTAPDAAGRDRARRRQASR